VVPHWKWGRHSAVELFTVERYRAYDWYAARDEIDSS